MLNRWLPMGLVVLSHLTSFSVKANNAWSSVVNVSAHCGDEVEEASHSTSQSQWREDDTPPPIKLTKAPPPAPKLVVNERQALLTAGSHLSDFLDDAGLLNIEREWAIRNLALGLLSRMHSLILGKPGNGKTMLADTFGSGIMLETPAGYERSYVRRQLDEEASAQYLFGALNYEIWSTTGDYIRHTDNGILNGHLVFLDETLDARVGVLRGIHEFMAEFKLTEGRVVTPAKLRMLIGATNEYMSETYRRVASDKPRAFFNRWGYIMIFPINFENVASFDHIETRKKKNKSVLTYQDLELLETLLPRVKMPRSIAQLVHWMSLKYQELADAEESKAFEAWKKKRLQDPFAFQEYRPTKYHSVRFANMALKALRANVVLDWVLSGGSRKLIADVDDVTKLIGFFGLDGPNRDLAQYQLSRAHMADEKAQWRTLEIERNLFDEVYKQGREGIERVAQAIDLTELNRKFQQAVSDEERALLSDELIALRANQTIPALPPDLKTWDFTEDHVGQFLVDDFLVECLVEIHGDRYDVANNVVLAQAPAKPKRQLAAPAPAPIPQVPPTALAAPAPAPLPAPAPQAVSLSDLIPDPQLAAASSTTTVNGGVGVGIVEGFDGRFHTGRMTLSRPRSNAEEIANGRLPHGTLIDLTIYDPTQTNSVLYTAWASLPGRFELASTSGSFQVGHQLNHVGEIHRLASEGTLIKLKNDHVVIVLQDPSGSDFRNFQSGQFNADVTFPNGAHPDVKGATALVKFTFPAGR